MQCTSGQTVTRILSIYKTYSHKTEHIIKTHKDNEPIRPAVNNTLDPSYKIVKFINKKLNSLLCLPYTYNTKNSQEIANELERMEIDKQMKVITLDIKDLFLNLRIQGFLTTTKFWLNRNIHDNELIKQTLYILEIIMKQNYFQYYGRFLQPDKGIAMGSHISSTMAEVYLQYKEETYGKQWLESKEIVYCKRYVDDILITYNQNKTNKQSILQ